MIARPSTSGPLSSSKRRNSGPPAEAQGGQPGVTSPVHSSEGEDFPVVQASQGSRPHARHWQPIGMARCLKHWRDEHHARAAAERAGHFARRMDANCRVAAFNSNSVPTQIRQRSELSVIGRRERANDKDAAAMRQIRQHSPNLAVERVANDNPVGGADLAAWHPATYSAVE